MWDVQTGKSTETDGESVGPGTWGRVHGERLQVDLMFLFKVMIMF